GHLLQQLGDGPAHVLEVVADRCGQICCQVTPQVGACPHEQHGEAVGHAVHREHPANPAYDVLGPGVVWAALQVVEHGEVTEVGPEQGVGAEDHLADGRADTVCADHEV